MRAITAWHRAFFGFTINPMFRVGVAKADITPMNVRGVGMMGWGRFDNRVGGDIESHLFARAFAITEPKSGFKLTIVVAEICFISIAVRQAVLERLNRDHPELGYGEDNLMLTATHTHSAPGGYSHYVLYNVMVPGFCPTVFNAYVDGIVKAIVQADRSQQDAQIRSGNGSFPLDIPIAFNRSIESWNLNPDVPKYSKRDAARAVNREMWLLRFDSPDGKPIGAINWFGVHATSVHGDNDKISSDNKGYAAREFERVMQAQNPDFVAGFAQAACGDVTPNFHRHRGVRDLRGKFKSDFRNARHNGTFQLKQAQILYREAEKTEPLAGRLDSAVEYFDFSGIDVDADLIGGLKGQTTGPAALGMPFILGTEEGPGAPVWMVSIVSLIERIRCLAVDTYNRFFRPERPRYKIDDPVHGKKVIFVESGERRILGATDLVKLIIPRWTDPAVREIKRLYETGALGTEPFTPQVLPLQIVMIGGHAIFAAPSEFTTTSANRMSKTLHEVLQAKGVERVQIQCYSNGYSGYVTTYEEYQNQKYEGGSTHFGKWTLAGYQTVARRLAKKLVADIPVRQAVSGAKPYRFSDEELSKRLFVR